MQRNPSDNGQLLLEYNRQAPAHFASSTALLIRSSPKANTNYTLLFAFYATFKQKSFFARAPNNGELELEQTNRCGAILFFSRA